MPTGLQVEMVDNSDTQNVSSTGTWSASNSGTGYNGYNYQSHAAGSGTDAFTWNLSIPEDGTYQVYVQYPQVTGAATTAQYTVNYNGGTATQTVDQTKNTGTWVSLGSYSFTQAGTGQKISLAQNSGGTVVADAVKVVRNNSGDTQPNPKSFAYTYDPNGNVTDLADNSPGAQFNDYAYTYDGLNRLTQLQEKLSGTVKHTTGFTYDAAGNPLSETHDASSAGYTFDVRNLLTQVVNKETSTDSGKTTSYTYTPALKVATETKANGNVVTNTYNLDNSLAGSVEKTSGGTVVSQHTLTYDPNGNQTQDVSVTQSADNSSASLNRTATDTYTPRDQVASVTNSDGNNNQSYTYDLAGNISSQTVGSTTTTNLYDRNRLLTATAGGATANYNYDPFGRTDTVTAAGTVIDRYTYDGFDHIAGETKNTGSGTVTTNYTYDPFDRTVSQTDNAGSSNAKTTNFDYLATSKALADESVGGTVTKTYQYNPAGERLAQIVHNTDGTETPTYYTYNPHTDVQAITVAGGNTKATYGDTAYGKDDTSQDTGVDKNTGSGATGTTTATPYNVYRFNSKRIDGDTGNYDMGFRSYDPSMNRFLTRDMYEGALADSDMTTDPYTGNRYAFGGGNPLSNVELDGHMLIDDNGCSGTVSGIEACEARQEKSQTEAADFPRYTAVRDFMYTAIYNMLGSRQYAEISGDLKKSANPPWWSFLDPNPLNSPSAEYKARAIAVWGAMVAPGQPWDFKVPLWPLMSQNPDHPSDAQGYMRFPLRPNVQVYYNIWANISFGYVGRAAGFSAHELQTGAEINAADNPFVKHTNTMGNWVGRQIGIDMYRDHPDGLTPEDIDEEINSHLDQLSQYQEVQPYPGGIVNNNEPFLPNPL